MNVREAVSVLKNAKKIMLAWSGNTIPFDKDDLLMMDAYGRYIVDEIVSAGGGVYEVIIAVQPVKEGAA